MSSGFQQVVHLNLAEDCMNKFKLNIEKLCKTEQVCTDPETPTSVIDSQSDFVSYHIKVLLNTAVEFHRIIDS